MLAHPLFALGGLLMSIALLAGQEIAPQSGATSVALWCGIATTAITAAIAVGGFTLRLLDRHRAGTVTLTDDQFDALLRRSKSAR